jgi:hypothetical protein
MACLSCFSPHSAATVALVSQIAAQTLACEALAVSPILGAGLINAVFRVETRREPCIVRLNQRDHLATYRKEHWCLQQLYGRFVFPCIFDR